MMKKFCLIFLTLVMAISVVALPVAVAADSVEDQMSAEEAAATPLVDENGNEIAFEVKGSAASNPAAGIVMMVGLVLICLLLCVDGVRSYIRRARKESKERFQTISKD